MTFRTIKLGLAVAAGLLFAATAADAASAANHCIKTGGVVQTRIPEYNTNGGGPLILARSQDFLQEHKKRRQPYRRAPEHTRDQAADARGSRLLRASPAGQLQRQSGLLLL